MKTQGNIDRVEQQLIKAGAAMAANNQQSFGEAYDELVSLGAGVDQIRFAAGVGKAVREKPATAMGKYVDDLFGVEPVEATGAKSCPAQGIKDETQLRLMMLIAAGSAVAANCEPCLNQSVLALADARASEADIRAAAEIGLHVKELQAEDIRDAAVVLTGIEEERRAA
jgi:hypothetical protein